MEKAFKIYYKTESRKIKIFNAQIQQQFSRLKLHQEIRGTKIATYKETRLKIMIKRQTTILAIALNLSG